ncbi:MAG: putative DNA-binding domain-containing protein [Sulfuricellaceae bacterium]|nr:putative DNA-binding domain-containing protein [Sulfuricellaceae bacterium]
MPRTPEFQRYQNAFAAHIRDPRANPRPRGVPARRMKVYNELLFNNIEGFLLACFPVLRQVLGVRRWTRLVRDFFAEHRCHTPIFRQIPDEFVRYLLQARAPNPDDPPFLNELAHYEWVELALAVAEQEPEWERIDPEGDLLEQRPALNPVLARLSYLYPVHRIGPRFKPAAPGPQPTLIAVFRTPDYAMRFVQLNPASMALLEILERDLCTGRQALERIASELKHPDPAQLILAGQEILRNLQHEGAILGAWKP